MDGVFWLCEHQLESIKPFFPKSPGVSRVDGSKVGSGSIYVHVTAGALVDAPTPSPTTAAPGGRWECSRCSSRNWRSAHTEAEAVLLLDATTVKAQRRASSLKKGALPLP